MRTIAQILALILVAFGSAHAGSTDVTLRATRTKLDESKSRSEGVATVRTKEIAYKVTVENTTFKDMNGVEIKYMIFYEDVDAGSTKGSPIKSVKGKQSIALLASRSAESFETSPIKLSTTDLDPGWMYGNGASNRARDSVKGIWLRAYLNGELVGEYAYPVTVPKKETWKD